MCLTSKVDAFSNSLLYRTLQFFLQFLQTRLDSMKILVVIVLCMVHKNTLILPLYILV